MSDNIIHMVLAKLPDAPSEIEEFLFLVPKYYEDENGNRIKMILKFFRTQVGHNASPTCVLSFGENDNCIGELIGEPHLGLKAMFTMMNNARLNVGVQGIAMAERSYQKALLFAKDRKQGFSLNKTKKEPVNIIEHPDVKRMLMEMKSQIEAMRGLCRNYRRNHRLLQTICHSEEGKHYLNW